MRDVDKILVLLGASLFAQCIIICLLSAVVA